nr:hypothetical protein [Tanacetum cinerariifolium]
MPQHIGIHYPKWRKVPKEKMDDLWSIAKIIKKDIKEWIISDMSTKWKCWKYELKKRSYDPTMTINEIMSSQTNDRVETGQFRTLVERWFTEEKQVESERKKINRLKSIEPHVTGTRSFIRVKDEEADIKPIGDSSSTDQETTNNSDWTNDDLSKDQVKYLRQGFMMFAAAVQEQVHNLNLSSVMNFMNMEADCLSSIHDNTIDKNLSSASGMSHH